MKNRKFKSLGTYKEVDLIPYLKEKLAERDDIKLYIGTDSQNVKRKTVYAVVIVLHYGNNGGHVIYSRIEVPRIRDMFTKLWREVEDSIALAKYLVENGIMEPTYIDIDFNPDPKYDSNTILRAALGYVEASGFKPRSKPDAMAASHVADHIVNS
jgi:predicted RNase H-related nuclease YkuK (DUF458 family)